MTKLTPLSAEQCALIDEAARQVKSGEAQAKFWLWHCKIDDASLSSNYPRFNDAAMAKLYHPAPAHPHYATYCEWYRLLDSGEAAKGWWCVLENTTVTLKPKWLPTESYLIIKTARHPDHCKPALKLIDWAKLIGCNTTQGELLKYATNLRLAEQTRFTHLQDGEAPPVIDGVVIEYEFVYKSHIGLNDNMNGGIIMRMKSKNPKEFTACVAYRILGLADGWTDDPSKAAL